MSTDQKGASGTPERGTCDECGRDVSINRSSGYVRAHGYEQPQNRCRVGDYCPGGGLPPKRDWTAPPNTWTVPATTSASADSQQVTQ